MKYLALPNQERIKSLLVYDPATGAFKWRVSLSCRAPVGSVAGTKKMNGYCCIALDNRKYQSHRLAWVYMTGRDPGQMLIDHINGIRDDNRWENLRLATRAQNQVNSKCPIRNASGLKGASKCPNAARWKATIRHGGKNVYLGIFQSPELAHEAYCRAAKKLYGDFANAG